MVGVADRVATARRAAIDAVAASWTIGNEEDGCVLHRSAWRVSGLVCAPCVTWPGVRRAGLAKGWARRWRRAQRRRRRRL